MLTRSAERHPFCREREGGSAGRTASITHSFNTMVSSPVTAQDLQNRSQRRPFCAIHRWNCNLPDGLQIQLLGISRLKSAVHIYEKYGFREIRLDDYEYDRGDIAFEYIVP